MRALLLLLLIALAASDAHARQGDIHHCVDAQGHPVFTDRSCAAMQATPAPAVPLPDASYPLAPLPVLCAATPEELRQQVVDAFAAHDPNRMAGLILWDGYSQRAAVTLIQALGALMQAPLLDVSIDDGPSPADGPSAEAASGHAETPLRPDSHADDPQAAGTALPGWLSVETADADATGLEIRSRFPMVAEAGCVWLRPIE